MVSRTFGAVALAAILMVAVLCSAIAQQPAPVKIPNAVEEQQRQELSPLNRFPGRYQVTTLGESFIVLVDTHTGHCWLRSSSLPWQDYGSPVKVKE
jgi:hypothetical protein